MPKHTSRKMSRREMLRLTALGTGGLVLSAYAGAAAAEEVARRPTGQELEGEVIFWGHDQHPLDLAGVGFEEATGVTWVSPHPADRGEKLQAVLAAGSDCPDLFWMEATQVNDLSCVGALVDITDNLEPVKDDYHPLKLAEATQPLDGRIYGWPGDISVSGWYYRYDILEELGYGDTDFETWTWDDFYAMSEDIAAQGKYTFCFPGAAWAALYMYVLHQLGGSVTNEEGSEITITSDEGVEAMSIIKKLYETGAGLDVEWWSPGYWVSIQEGELMGDFAAAWARGFIEAQVETEEQGVGKWRVAKFPGGENIKYRTGIWGGATLVSLFCSQNVDNAIAYMEYALGSVEGANLVGGWGIVPAYRPYLESADFLDARAELFGDWAFNQFWAEQEKELSLTYYRRAGYSPIETAIHETMPAIMREEMTVEEGMQAATDLAWPDVERVMCVM